MIIGNPYQIAIQMELIDVLCSPCGVFNFIVNDMFVPGKGVTIDLYVVISSLKGSLEEGLRLINNDIGDLSLDCLSFLDGTPENLIALNVAELYDYGCNFWLGFDGDEERLIYTVDFENSYMESRFPRGTVESLIRTLPLAETLVIDKDNNMIITKPN